MELRLFISNLLRGWYILLIALVLGLAAAGAHVAAEQAGYQSTARLYVNVRAAASINDLAQANTLSQQLAANYAQLAGTRYVLERAATRLGGGVTAEQLESKVTAVAAENTAFLTVTATASSASAAARTADAVSQSLIAASLSLAESSSSANRTLQLTEVQPAEVPASATSGSLVAELPLGAAIGLLLGIAVVILRDRFDTRLRSLSRVAEVTDSEVLGMIPPDRRAGSTAALALPSRSRDRYEAFRSLRTALAGQGLLPQAGTSIAVISSVPGEGRSTTLAGLAVAIAASGRRVVIVEGDLKRSSVARSFGVQPGPGLSDVLRGEKAVADVVQRVALEERIGVVRAGSAERNGEELVESSGFDSLIRQAAEGGAIVLVDTPPLLAASDASAIARRVEHVLLLVDVPTVKDREVARSIAVLRQVRLTVGGVVVNRIPRGWADRGGGSAAI